MTQSTSEKEKGLKMAEEPLGELRTITEMELEACEATRCDRRPAGSRVELWHVMWNYGSGYTENCTKILVARVKTVEQMTTLFAICVPTARLKTMHRVDAVMNADQTINLVKV